MDEKEQYKSLIGEVIQKQAIILGPQMAIARAKRVQELVISDKGVVLEITGDPQVVVQKLIDQYVELSGLIVKNALSSVFVKYPSVKKID